MYRFVSGAGALALALAVSPGVSAKTHVLTPLHAFEAEAEGYAPAVVATDREGYLYGFTQYGGGLGNCPYGGCGTVFKLKPGGDPIVLHAFRGAPSDAGGLTGIALDGAGNIYGTSIMGGREDFGAVFKIAADGSESVLHTFRTPVHNESPGGIWPTGGLVLGHDGNLYGTTWHGGIDNQCGEGGCGTVFRITPAGKLKTVYAFKGPGDACAAFSGLAIDAAGNLYGTTQGCGFGDSGSVYRVAPDGTETVLHVFTNGLDGADPIAAPVLDAAGNLYGGTLMGGGDGCGGSLAGPGCGILYKIAPDGTETVLHRLDGLDGRGVLGASVAAPLVIDDAGNLYGTATRGGAVYGCNPGYGCGTVFELTPDGTMTVLHKFLGARGGDGAMPYTGLVRGTHKSRDSFFGSTEIGPGCCGLIFQIQK